MRRMWRASCELREDGPYASLAECTAQEKCGYMWACNPALQVCEQTESGTYATQEECALAEQCGFKWGCNAALGVCEPSASGTYATEKECRTGAQCGYMYGCDASGACVLMDGGMYGTTPSCRCFDCDSAQGKCVPVGYNQQGTFETLEQCQADSGAQCGWKWGCDGTDVNAVGSGLYCRKMPNGQWDYASDCNCVSCVGGPGPGGNCTYNPDAPVEARFHDLATCQSSPDATYGKCGWKYKCV